MSKIEITMQYFDEWMLRWRHYQTVQDWEIEKCRQWWRRFDYTAGATVGGAMGLYTIGHGTVRRWWGPQGPHFFDNGVDRSFKDFMYNKFIGTQRYAPKGWGRVLAIGLPMYMTIVTLEHKADIRRNEQYLKAETAFGEQARRYAKTGKIEEMLCVNIQASLPENERVIYGQ